MPPPSKRRPSKRRRGITLRQAKAVRCSIWVRVGPFHLPGTGYGAIRSQDRAVVKKATGCHIGIRKRPAWPCRMLTLCGPAERITQAKSMAEAFILRSQQKRPTQMPSMMPQQSFTFPPPFGFPGWPQMPHMWPQMPQMQSMMPPHMCPFGFPGWPQPTCAKDINSDADSVDSSDEWSESPVEVSDKWSESPVEIPGPPTPEGPAPRTS